MAIASLEWPIAQPRPRQRIPHQDVGWGAPIKHGIMLWMRLGPAHVAPFLFDALSHAHERKPFVGGLFNAYEPAVHYELFNAALVHELDQTLQEEPLGNGQTSCDLVLPLDGDAWLWLEVKMWWFLHQAYESPYVMLGKTQSWPAADWERLAEVPLPGLRALLLIRVWDDEAARQKADAWLASLISLLTPAGAPTDPSCRSLQAYAYAGPRIHTRHGDMILWCGPATHKPRDRSVR